MAVCHPAQAHRKAVRRESERERERIRKQRCHEKQRRHTRDDGHPFGVSGEASLSCPGFRNCSSNNGLPPTQPQPELVPSLTSRVLRHIDLEINF